MAALLEPPPLVAIALIIVGAAVAVLVAVRASRATTGIHAVVAEDDEDWGVDDPPLPGKRPFTYVEPETDPVQEQPSDGPPLPVLPPVPLVVEHVEQPVQALQPEVLPDERHGAVEDRKRGGAAENDEDSAEEDEALSNLSPADFYRPRPRAGTARSEHPEPREEEG